jgi:hypothetical protein
MKGVEARDVKVMKNDGGGVEFKVWEGEGVAGSRNSRCVYV